MVRLTFPFVAGSEKPCRGFSDSKIPRADRLDVAEKVRRSGEMARWAREWIGRQIVAEHGPMSERRLKIEVALRIYANEPEVVRQLKELLRETSE